MKGNELQTDRYSPAFEILLFLTFVAVKAKLIKCFFVAWFAFLVMLGNTPMDFIHQFADHKDTVHKEHRGLVIEKKHHHCAYLSIKLSTFTNDYQFRLVLHPHSEFFIRHATLPTHFVQRSIVAAALRGPPVA